MSQTYAHAGHIVIYVVIAIMYFWLTNEYANSNPKKGHKPQYTGIGLCYVGLAFIVGYEIYLHSKHKDSSHQNKENASKDE